MFCRVDAAFFACQFVNCTLLCWYRPPLRIPPPFAIKPRLGQNNITKYPLESVSRGSLSAQTFICRTNYPIWWHCVCVKQANPCKHLRYITNIWASTDTIRCENRRQLKSIFERGQRLACVAVLIYWKVMLKNLSVIFYSISSASIITASLRIIAFYRLRVYYAVKSMKYI